MHGKFELHGVNMAFQLRTGVSGGLLYYLGLGQVGKEKKENEKLKAQRKIRKEEIFLRKGH